MTRLQRHRASRKPRLDLPEGILDPDGVALAVLAEQGPGPIRPEQSGQVVSVLPLPFTDQRASTDERVERLVKDLWESENTNIPFYIPSSGRLRLLLNRKILDVAQLRLRFCSIGVAKSNPKPGVILVNWYFPTPLE